MGVWIRLGWQDDQAAVAHKDQYSGGVQIDGALWDREYDAIGLGYARLTGGNLDIDKTDLVELYARVGINEVLSVTGDVQYLQDTLIDGDGPQGWVFGLRATARF